MNTAQVGMLALEAVVMAVIILGLFRARTTLGLTPLYIVLGGFQFLEATVNLKVEVTPSIVVNPASVVLFVATLVIVLLIYLKEDAIEARKLAYGLVLANVAVSIISLLLGYHIDVPGSTSIGMTAGVFKSGSLISMLGTSLLLLDVIGIILLYEFVSRLVTGLFWRFYLSLTVIAAFDNVVFTMMVQIGRPGAWHLVNAGLLGKSVTALFYSVACWTYLRYVEPRTATVGTGDVADVFQALTYRQRFEQAQQRMVRDALTGLFNRGYFDEALPQALARAKRYREPLSLAIIDTDNFKAINDSLSHMEGDHALRVIAATLIEHSRAGDVPCRYGGDEFVVILSRADAASAASFAERFRAGLAARCRDASPPFAWGTITTTIGIATYPADRDVVTPDDLFRAADRRLYLGKEAGRDQAVAHPH